MAQPTTISRSIRFAPQDAYMIDLAARVQRRSFSSFVNVAAIQVASNNEFRDGSTIGSRIESLWDIDPDVRLKRLQEYDPTLLTYEEQVHLRALEEAK